MKLFSLLFITLFLASCANKNVVAAQLSYHTETPKGEYKSTVFSYTHKGRILNMRRIPDFTLTDIATHSPFVAKDTSYGTIFTLNQRGKHRLYNHTVSNQGYHMISSVNGNLSEPLKIDKPIGDGKLVIWNGLTERDIHQLNFTVPHEGDTADMTKERIKLAKKALKKYKSPQANSEFN